MPQNIALILWPFKYCKNSFTVLVPELQVQQLKVNNNVREVIFSLQPADLCSAHCFGPWKRLLHQELC